MIRAMIRTGALALCVHSAALPAQPPVANAPLVPLFTNYSYFNHHWIHWLRDHPVYEAIEAQIYERPSGQRFIRVFLTERAPPKRQTYYFSDAGTVARWSTGRAHLRDFDLASSANAGGARDLVLRFRDAEGAPVEWTMEFEPGDRLVSFAAGLRPSAGHAADTAHIFHHYGNSAIARRSRLTIGSAAYDYARTQADFTTRGQKTGYSTDSYTPVMRLGDFACTGGAASLSCDQGRVFTPVAGAAGVWRTAPFGFGGSNLVELRLAGSAVASYTHRFDDHAFRFDFEPALPPLAALRGGESFAYAVSLDGRAPVVRGRISATRAEGGDMVLRWSPETPHWMAAFPLTSRVTPRGAGYGLQLRAGRSE